MKLYKVAKALREWRCRRGHHEWSMSWRATNSPYLYHRKCLHCETFQGTLDRETPGITQNWFPADLDTLLLLSSIAPPQDGRQ